MSGVGPNRAHRHLPSMALAVVVLMVAIGIAAGFGLGTNTASGDQGSSSSGSLAPTAAQTRDALESGNGQLILEKPETDLRAAQTMPHRNLERGEALELAEAVFQPEIEGPSGIYDELEPERFLGDHAAVVPASSLPEGSRSTDGSLPSEHPNMPVLVESTLPLRAENNSGEEEAVNLQLEHSEGELQAENPLADVGIPERLGEGITMGGPEVEIRIAESPGERTATDAEGEFAFYPAVSKDSDLIVTPTPQGVETMVDLRSAEAPTETTYELTLPPAADLRVGEQGGAEVVDGTHATLVIPPPTAVDAAGDPVQTELTVSADDITVITKPNPSTAFPVLVDPVFIEEGWRWTLNHDTMGAWTPSTTDIWALQPMLWEAWEPAGQYPGLDLSSGGSEAHWGDHADWEYWVPRYLSDVQSSLHEAPSTWVYQMNVEGPAFYEYGNTENYPALVVGLVDPKAGWQGEYGVHYGGNGDLNNWGQWYTYSNPTEQHGTKGADMDLVTYAEERPAKRRDAYLPDAYVAVVDQDAPEIAEINPPAHWTNGYTAPSSYRFQDKGLGVKSMEVSYGGHDLQEISFACGDSITPCARFRTQEEQPLSFNTAMWMPTGLDWVTITARDPMWNLGVGGHAASTNMLVKVDHTQPSISLSGSLTEQSSIGTRRPAYVLRVGAVDGTAGAPQSGIKKVEVLVDNKPVLMPEGSEWEPNCQAENCAFNGEWTMYASEYAAGPHEVTVISTDAATNVQKKTLNVELHQAPPSLAVSGSLTEQAIRGTERPSYTLKLDASALTESPPAAAIPAYSSSVGTSGAGNGQLAHPGDVAVGAEGNLFVVDTNNDRIEKFSESGAYLSQFGTKGSGNGQLNRPSALAVAANGNVWVTDSLNRRVEEFTSVGAYVAQFGGAGTGSGQFAGSGPEGIAIDYHGNIWVADTYGGRLEKFSEAGQFIRSVGTKGTAYEQLGQPTAVEVAPGGQVYVTDWEDDKVAEYGEGGAFIRQFGSQGNEPGQLQQPTGIAIDSRGDVWVGDQENQRVDEFNQAGEYLSRFGTEGSGAGQFRLQYPIGIATDAKGDLWVTDALDNRVEKWVSSGYANPSVPTFLRAIGSAGSGNGQFEWPTGIAVDSKNNIWVTDLLHNRLEKLNEKGQYLSQFGSGGTGNGQFDHPMTLAIDSKGDLWATDTESNRIEEFSETGTFIRAVGSKGIANGQFNWPAGIAIDSENDVWVADTNNNRIEEFSETGAFMRSFGSKGSGAGQMVEPYGVAISPEGNIWVADTTNKRLDEFTATGTFIRSVGGAGSGLGQFNVPTDVDIDAAGHLWVTDMNNARVQEFSSGGQFLSTFGSPGTGEANFYRPGTLALDHAGHIWVTDYERNRVEEWTLPTTHSQVSIEITVDGKRVEASETACVTEACATTKEWTLQTSSFTPGSHAVVVRATDGLGNTTSKTLNVTLGDATKPGLEVGGELATAPEGWIEQAEGNYGFHATATDAGYGVTSLVFSLDGQAVASETQGCPAGACSTTITATVNAHSLAAGAHLAEVVATDGAGNLSTKKWTVNVDPEGVISTEELAATAEAVEESSGSPILSAAEGIPGIEGSMSGVGLTEGEEPGTLRATGSYVPMSVSGAAEEGFELHVAGLSSLAVACDEVEDPEEMECVPREALEAAQAAEELQIAEGLKYPGMTPITVKPVTIGPAATEQELLGDNTAGSANAGGEEWDTFTRPMSDGGLSFADIRGSAAPEHYAYEMNLSPELQLRQPDPQHVEVIYWKYGVTAFVITAEQAHDVIGSAVPTHLSISGPAKITLTVEHRGASPAGGSFVYPVMGGAGWQGGYYAVGFEMNEPLPPAESGEEEEELEEEEVAVSPDGEFVHVSLMGYGPRHITYSGDINTPNKGWVQYIGRECDFLLGEYSGERPGDGPKPPPPAGGKYAGASEEVLNELIYHCHKHPNEQGGWIRPRFAVEVNGTYSWVYGEEAKLRTKPECRVGGLFPPTKEGCGGPKGEVRAGGTNPKVSAYNRVWFSDGTYHGAIPWCAVLEVVLPSEPKLSGKHTFDTAYSIAHYIHWHKHEQAPHETADECPWEHF